MASSPLLLPPSFPLEQAMPSPLLPPLLLPPPLLPSLHPPPLLSLFQSRHARGGLGARRMELPIARDSLGLRVERHALFPCVTTQKGQWEKRRWGWGGGVRNGRRLGRSQPKCSCRLGSGLQVTMVDVSKNLITRQHRGCDPKRGFKARLCGVEREGNRVTIPNGVHTLLQNSGAFFPAISYHSLPIPPSTP